MKGRLLRKDELELWKRISGSVQSSSVKGHDLAKKIAIEPKVTSTDYDSIQFSLDKQARLSQTKAPPPRAVTTSIAMDQKAYRKLRSGKLKPEAKIDLHGLTQDRAYPALVSFVLSAHSNGKRLLLVVTGKGKNKDEGGPIPVRQGVLRQKVPSWLGHAPLSSIVMQTSRAHQSHGGDGALYVYLRRQR